MDLAKLFEMQRKLDAHIEKEHPRQEGEDRLAKKILALQVELGELAQEWRGFKFWSKDQEPRTESKVVCHACKGQGGFVYTDEYQQATEPFEECLYCEGTGFQEDKNPLLEEFVDCLHFILSIGNEINMNEVYEDSAPKPVYFDDIIDQFMSVNHDISPLYYNRHNDDINGEIYDLIVAIFLGLGEMLGFTWDQIEEAYMKKNQENHRRQEVGY